MPGTPLALALDSRCVGPPSSPIESTFVPQLPHGCLSAYGASLATLVVQTVSVSGKACGVRILLRGEGAVAPLCAHFFQWFEPLQTSPTRSRLDLSQGSDGTQAFNSTPTISVLIQFHTPAALVSLCRCDPARLLDPYSLVRVTCPSGATVQLGSSSSSALHGLHDAPAAPCQAVVDVQVPDIKLSPVSLVAFSHGSAARLLAACVGNSLAVYSLERCELSFLHCNDAALLPHSLQHACTSNHRMSSPTGNCYLNCMHS